MVSHRPDEDSIIDSIAKNPAGAVMGGLIIAALTHSTNARADSLVASLTPSPASITVHDLDTGGSSSVSLPAGTSTSTLDGFDDGSGNAILSTTDGSVAPYYGTGTDGIVVTDGSSATLELSFPYPGRLAPNLDEGTFAVPSLYDGSLSIVKTDFSDEESYNSLSGSVVLAFAADEADQYAVATDYVSGGSSIHVIDLGSDTDGDGLPDSGDSIVSTDDFSTADPEDYGQSLTLDRTNDVAYGIGVGTSDTVDGSTTVRLDINTGSIIEVNTEDASGNPVNANQIIYNPTDGYLYAVGIPTSGSYNCVILQLNPSDLSVNSELGHSSSCAGSAVELTIEASGVYAWLAANSATLREVDLSTMSFTGTTKSTSYATLALVHVTTPTTTTYYADSDGDGYGDPATTTEDTSAPTGYVEDNTDCDDGDPTIGAPSTHYADSDGDGYGDAATGATTCPASGYVENATDCDDGDPAVNPGEVEDTTDSGECDGIDTDCSDGDGDGVDTFELADTTCTDDDGDSLTERDGDCDDANASVTTESDFYLDEDGDNYGTGTASLECGPTGLYTAVVDGDCDDEDDLVHPDAAEPDCVDDLADAQDMNCNNVLPTECRYDADGDGYEDDAMGGTDCDDENANMNPGAEELCDAIDRNCDGDPTAGATDATTGYVDGDSDGYGTDETLMTCDTTLITDVNGDCDDTVATTYPDAPEGTVGVDSDCDSLIACDVEGGMTWTDDCDTYVSEGGNTIDAEGMTVDYTETEEMGFLDYLTQEGYGVSELLVHRTGDGPVVTVRGGDVLETGIRDTIVNFQVNNLNDETTMTVVDENDTEAHKAELRVPLGNFTLRETYSATVDNVTGEILNTNDAQLLAAWDAAQPVEGDDTGTRPPSDEGCEGGCGTTGTGGPEGAAAAALLAALAASRRKEYDLIQSVMEMVGSVRGAMKKAWERGVSA